MSLFDQQSTFVTLEEAYPNEAPFILLSAFYEGMRKTQFGDRECAKLHVVSKADPNESAQEFSVWGAVAKQIEASEGAEFPVRCFYKQGKPNRLEPAAPAMSEAEKQALLAPAPTPF